MADTLALENLYTRVVAALPGVPQPFGWREKPRHGEAARIVWQPGDPLGALGNIKGTEAKQPGRFPKRPLGTLHELFTVWIHAADLTKPRDEAAQYKATRLLFDEWYAAVYRIARGTFQIKAANWELIHIEGKFGGCIRVVATVEAMLPDTVRERAPTDTGATIKTALVATADASIVIPPQLEKSIVFILDSSPFITATSPYQRDRDSAEVWGYSARALSGVTYTNEPTQAMTLHGPLPFNSQMGPGRGHGLSVLKSGHLLIAASEKSGGNYNEGWTLVPPGAHGKLDAADCPFYKSGDIFGGLVLGARHCLQFDDGTILIGYPSRWVMCSLDDLIAGNMTGLPTWTLPGGAGTYAKYDAAAIPGTKRVIFENDNGLSIVDFNVPPGAIDPASVKRAQGSNFGTGPGDLVGQLALGPDLRLYKQRVSGPDIAWWNLSTLEALTSTPSNPAPDGVLTSPVFTNLQAGVEHLFCCLDFDSQGRLYTASQRSSNYANAVGESATMWRFSAAAAAAGGAQSPELTVTLPSRSQPWMLRCTPGMFKR